MSTLSMPTAKEPLCPFMKKFSFLRLQNEELLSDKSR